MDSLLKITQWQEAISHERNVEEPSFLIAHVYEACSSLFKDLLSALASSSADNSSIRSLEQSHSYLRLWADGFGVKNGQLDRSLDKSRRARNSTIRLLGSICQTLTQRLFIVLPAEEQTRLKSQAAEVTVAAEKLRYLTQPNEQDSSDTESEISSIPESTSVLEIVEDLKTDTQCLMDLGSRFEDQNVGPIVPATDEEPAGLETLNNWDPSQNFTDRIRWRYPSCEVGLADRLGKANWTRVLRYRNLQISQTQIPIPEDTTTRAIKLADTVSTAYHDSALGSSVPSALAGQAISLNHHTPRSYAETAVSYRGEQGESVRLPSLSESARRGTPFSCIGCGKMVKISSTSAWKRHLFLDLRPYVCLEGKCSFSGSPFETKAQWVEHLSLDHRFSQIGWESMNCPICDSKTESGKLNVITHFSRHLEEISLTVLPTYADSEDGTDDSGLASSESSSDNDLDNDITQNLFPTSHFNILADRIDQNILQPLFATPAFKDFQPIIVKLREKLRYHLASVSLREVEQDLILKAKEHTTDKVLCLDFRLTCIRAIQSTVEFISIEDQKKALQRPYTDDYFSDLINYVHNDRVAEFPPYEIESKTEIRTFANEVSAENGPEVRPIPSSANYTFRTFNSPDDDAHTIKCICDYVDDDGNSIFCEKCNTWQHIECYYPDNIKDAYEVGFEHLCIDCNPQQLLDRHLAKARQQNKHGSKPLPPKSHKKKTQERQQNRLTIDTQRAFQRQIIEVKSSESMKGGEDTTTTSAIARRSKVSHLEQALKICSRPGCGKKLKRSCDLVKHEKTHIRPWKCPIPSCKYHEYGWPTEKEKDRHVNDKHSGSISLFECLFQPCLYKSKRESNLKQHMEKAHGWEYIRSKHSKKQPEHLETRVTTWLDKHDAAEAPFEANRSRASVLLDPPLTDEAEAEAERLGLSIDVYNAVIALAKDDNPRTWDKIRQDLWLEGLDTFANLELCRPQIETIYRDTQESFLDHSWPSATTQQQGPVNPTPQRIPLAMSYAITQLATYGEPRIWEDIKVELTQHGFAPSKIESLRASIEEHHKYLQVQDGARYNAQQFARRSNAVLPHEEFGKLPMLSFQEATEDRGWLDEWDEHGPTRGPESYVNWAPVFHGPEEQGFPSTTSQPTMAFKAAHDLFDNSPSQSLPKSIPQALNPYNIPILDMTLSASPAPTSAGTTLRCHCGYVPTGSEEFKASNLRRHKRIQHGTLGYRCGYPGCKSEYTRRDNLIIHQRLKGHSSVYRDTSAYSSKNSKESEDEKSRRAGGKKDNGEALLFEPSPLGGYP